MPLYEFRCKKCGCQFEQIVFLADGEPVKCPKCGVADPERLLSTFSSCRSSQETIASGGSSCSAPSSGFS
ncbi:MAG: zinc ribbon domain-containing protein [Proteobacteria bacterium]|nr:zinc ribbon domain-containing protein [Pseudomonadota bacterium]